MLWSLLIVGWLLCSIPFAVIIGRMIRKSERRG